MQIKGKKLELHFDDKKIKLSDGGSNVDNYFDI